MSLAATALTINAVLVLITGYYAWTTRRLLDANLQAVKSMREEIEAATRPYVTVRTHTSVGRPIIQLTVTNDGRSAAENLAVRLDKDIYTFGRENDEENLRNKPFFRDVIATFPPGGSMVFDLVEGWKQHTEEGEVPAIFSVSASYEFRSKKFLEVTKVDLRTFAGSLYPYDPIHSELEKIRGVLEKKLK
jgi:hypothetical protein